MKKRFVIVLILWSLLNTAAIAYIIYRGNPCSAPQSETVLQEEIILQHSDTPSEVFVPQNFNLAGEQVPLTRRDVFESLQRELIVNTYLHSSTIQLLKKSSPYFERIVPILKQEGVPEDFKYLAVIESNLNPLAVSPAGATGIWQFMKGTAKEYGLEVGDDVDERYHIEKATKAACAYLKKAYDKFGSWTLAAASYNGGMNLITKQMDLQKENNYYNLLLGEETSRYIFRLLALKQILENPRQYGFNVTTVYSPEPFETVKVNNSIKDLAEFAQQYGITYKTLKRFNPWLRKTSLKVNKNENYSIAIPVDKNAYK